MRFVLASLLLVACAEAIQWTSTFTNLTSTQIFLGTPMRVKVRVNATLQELNLDGYKNLSQIVRFRLVGKKPSDTRMLLVTTLNMVLNKTVTVPGPKNVTVGSGYKIQMIIKNAVPVSVTKEFSLLTLPSRADLTWKFGAFPNIVTSPSLLKFPVTLKAKLDQLLAMKVQIDAKIIKVSISFDPPTAKPIAVRYMSYRDIVTSPTVAIKLPEVLGGSSMALEISMPFVCLPQKECPTTLVKVSGPKFRTDCVGGQPCR